MMKLLLAFSVLAVGALAAQVRYDGYAVFRFFPENQRQLAVLRDLKKNSSFDFWLHPSAINKNVDVRIPPHLVKNFLAVTREVDLKSTVLIENVQKLVDKHKEETLHRSKTMDWKSYHTLEEFEAWMEELSKKYSHVKKIIVGRTYENRSINAVEITFKEGQPTVFIESGIHAREWIAPAATSFVVNEILSSNESSIFREFNYIYVPFFNPDGYVYSWTTNRLWRKTRKPYTVNGITCYGADPNRNWDYYWMGDDDPCEEEYPGPEPFSENETRSLSEFFQEYTKERKIDVYLSFHSYSQLLMYPWASRPDPAPEAEYWKKVGTAAAEALKAVNGTEFIVGDVYHTIYPAMGVSLDYVYAKYNPRLIFVYELRNRGKYGFLLPEELIEPSGKELTASFEKILEGYKAKDK